MKTKDEIIGISIFFSDVFQPNEDFKDGKPKNAAIGRMEIRVDQ